MYLVDIESDAIGVVIVVKTEVPYSAAYSTPGINQETWLRLSSIPGGIM